MKKSALFTFSLFLLTLTAAEAAVKMKQTVSLTKGWNAVYVRVGPEESADALFADWPVRWVALYNPAQYGDTRQFDQKCETEGTTGSGYLIWRRGDKGASTLFSVPANSVLVAFATNACTSTFYGTPRAPRLTWHDSLARGMMNVVGFSTWSDTLTDAYFSGLDVGDAPFYVFGGGANANYPSVLPVTMVGARHFKDGEVLLLDSKKTSDWSGVLNVSPASGLDFGTELNKSSLEVRNDGVEPREVELIVRRGELPPNSGVAPDVPAFHCRDSVSAITNGPWTALVEGVGVRRMLSTGETWKVELAVDRTKMNSASGTVWGAVFEFRDVSEASVNEKNVLVGGSHMNAFVPVTVTDNGPEARDVWQRGLWLAHADLDTVTYLRKAETYQGKETFDLPSGGKMTVRLPVYIEPKKGGGVKMYLLQRFWYGRDTNGVLKVFSGQVKTAGEPLTDLKRLSTPFVPTDKPVTSFSKATLDNPALVKFTVGETSRGNPMYHANHPQHDALKADYSGRTPSGDNLNNYIATVKPETFSITNWIEFAWDRSNPAWEPEETMTGTLTWEFDGLRHQEGESPDGKLRARGKFTMKHLTSAPVKLK